MQLPSISFLFFLRVEPSFQSSHPLFSCFHSANTSWWPLVCQELFKPGSIWHDLCPQGTHSWPRWWQVYKNQSLPCAICYTFCVWWVVPGSREDWSFLFGRQVPEKASQRSDIGDLEKWRDSTRTARTEAWRGKRERERKKERWVHYDWNMSR